eukprot:TRINITY_DN4766_c0_g1::TRINITY_DN4766_c0_g1_i1::g.21366::m.21366 TRINITY_DN4766_c0_g1::TRINITY_DN4766_c0_g1_i1::g.21366  ORF type:complete len:268 (+),score=-7.94,sp/Q1PDP9/MY115_ARATH/32.52/8e-13,Myb_DNA-binding/PF00249.26/8.3e-09,Myb_DNA-binding/PF00249.26/3.7e-08,Myb_DNA-bind_6/PF13921.1/4.2e-11,Myb_DNA-bind_6/PF13921.1/1.1e-07,Myb_DNA-bind_6/PF13921.1/1.1e+04 TRINITY_DN4766_c0_g1_i1:93-896(+)
MGLQSWQAHEDELLLNTVKRVGEKWTSVALNISGRNPRECRDRWIKHVSKRLDSPWTLEENKLLMQLHQDCEGGWDKILPHFPKRQPQSVKDHWKILSRSARTQQGTSKTRQSDKKRALESDSESGCDSESMMDDVPSPSVIVRRKRAYVRPPSLRVPEPSIDSYSLCTPGSDPVFLTPRRSARLATQARRDDLNTSPISNDSSPSKSPYTPKRHACTSSQLDISWDNSPTLRKLWAFCSIASPQARIIENQAGLTNCGTPNRATRS